MCFVDLGRVKVFYVVRYFDNNLYRIFFENRYSIVLK